MTNPTPYAAVSPALIDRHIATLNVKLDTLSWLTTPYGRVQRVQQERSGAQYVFPGVYVGSTGRGNYLNLLPDANLGCYSYWEIQDPERLINWDDSAMTRMEADFGLVVWFDFRKLYPSDWQGRLVSNVVTQVVEVLETGGVSTGSIQINSFSYSAENIYRGYTHREIDRQFLFKPYGGFRIDGTLIYVEPCS